jgi:hypothetical protein
MKAHAALVDEFGATPWWHGGGSLEWEVRNANVNWLIATTMLITREQTRVVAKRTPPVLAFPAGILIIPARASLGTNQQSRL